MSINFRLFSQSDTLPWAPTGATWIYEIDSYQGKVPYIGFIYLSYVKDTLLLGKLVKKITVSDFRDIFMYNSNDSLYWLVENKYELLLVFSAEIGDSWTTKGRDETVFCKPFINSYDTITVRNISNKTFSNKDFEVIENRMSNCTWQLGPIIKNIGLSNFFEPIYFPKESCGYVTCQPLNINLACYYDMRRGIINFGNHFENNSFFPQYSCSNLLSSKFTGVAVNNKIFEIVPNPVSTTLHVVENFQNNFESVKIYDLLGREFVSIAAFSGSDIDVSILQTGVYILQIQTRDGIFGSTKFLKIN